MTAVLVVLLAACSTSTTLPPPPRTEATAPVDLSAPGVRHLEYVFPAGSMQVFDVDHDLRLIMKLCDRIQVLNYGRLIAEGEPDAVRANPDVIAAYLGQARSA